MTGSDLTPDKQLTTRSGASARLVEDPDRSELQIADTEGRLLVAYDADSGTMTLTVPAGHLVLQAPQGDVTLKAGGTLALSGRRLDARFAEADAEIGRARTRIGRLVQSLGSAYTRVAGLSQLLARRRRVLVREDDCLRARDVSVNAERDVRANGKQIRLG